MPDTLGFSTILKRCKKINCTWICTQRNKNTRMEFSCFVFAWAFMLIIMHPVTWFFPPITNTIPHFSWRAMLSVVKCVNELRVTAWCFPCLKYDVNTSLFTVYFSGGFKHRVIRLSTQVSGNTLSNYSNYLPTWSQVKLSHDLLFWWHN